MTNFDKVKEIISIDNCQDFDDLDNAICKAIHQIKNEKTCYGDFNRNCIECFEWLKKKYKEQILTKEEYEYLSSVIKPFRDKVINITKLINDDDLEFIEIGLNDNTDAILPAFSKYTRYKDMVYGKEYALEELDL